MNCIQHDPAPANLTATGGDLEGEVDLSWDAIARGLQTYLLSEETEYWLESLVDSG